MTRTVLGIKLYLKLVEFVKAEYTKSGLNDMQFARQAETALEMPGLNGNHIATAREAAEIPTNVLPGQNGKGREQQLELVDMKTRIPALQRSIAQLATHKLG